MNKRANRKAFSVCISIFLFYLWIGTGLYEKSVWKRHALEGKIGALSMGINFDRENKKDGKKVIEPVKSNKTEERGIERNKIQKIDGAEMFEPSYLISIPLVVFAIEHNLLERESLIPSKKDGHSNALNWKKPIDILKEKDDDGLINISKTIGLKNLLRILREEGIEVEEGLSSGEVLLGRGYEIDKKKLICLYNRYVGDRYRGLFPYTAGDITIYKKGEGFEFLPQKFSYQQNKAEQRIDVWEMPDLRGLPLKTALKRLTDYTENIRIYGFGIVQDQFPRPQDKISSDTVCALYGKTGGR